MSNAFLLTSASNLPPQVATSYTTDNGTAVPALNILDVRGIDVTENNDNGIKVEGGLAETGAANRVQVQLTNRLQNTGSTVGATSADIITFPLTVVGAYQFKLNVVAYNSTSSLSAAYDILGGVRFDGANAVLTNNPITNDDEEGTMSNCDLDIVVSGANAILRVTGYADGGTDQTINWGAVGLYIFRGA